MVVCTVICSGLVSLKRAQCQPFHYGATHQRGATIPPDASGRVLGDEPEAAAGNAQTTTPPATSDRNGSRAIGARKMPHASEEDAALEAIVALEQLSEAQQRAWTAVQQLTAADTESPFADVHALLRRYDILYFRGRLHARVELSWSSKLTL